MMKNEIINSHDISVVVQGAIDRVNTSLCLSSVRKYLPDAEIILSTWEGSSVRDLDFDILIFNKDPGPIVSRLNGTVDNTSRQIISTIEGIRQSKRQYVLKLRSDCVLNSNSFLDFFRLYPQRNKFYSFFKKRIIASTLFSKRFLDRNSLIPTPFHISDWFHFGCKEDLLLLWDIPIISDEDYDIYNYGLEGAYSGLWMSSRYSAEQYILFNSVIKKYKNVNFDNMLDFNSENIGFSERFIANNFILKAPKSLGFLIYKEPYKQQIEGYEHFLEDQPGCLIDEDEFGVIYKKYSSGEN